MDRLNHSASSFSPQPTQILRRLPTHPSGWLWMVILMLLLLLSLGLLFTPETVVIAVL